APFESAGGRCSAAYITSTSAWLELDGILPPFTCELGPATVRVAWLLESSDPGSLLAPASTRAGRSRRPSGLVVRVARKDVCRLKRLLSRRALLVPVLAGSAGVLL